MTAVYGSRRTTKRRTSRASGVAGIATTHIVDPAGCAAVEACDRPHAYCWRAAEFSGGSIGAPARILIAGAHDVHIASDGGVTQHLLDFTDFDDATRIYVDNNDRVFLEGRMQDFDADALGRVELTDPPSSQILVLWPSPPGFGDSSPLRDATIGQGGEVLVLREVGDTTVLEQRALD